MVKLNRRQFIILSAVGAGVAVVSNWLSQKTIFSEPLLLPRSSASITPLHQSSDGLLELDLEARESLVELSGKQAYFLTYNGQIPAPRLEAKPGDTVRILDRNNRDTPIVLATVNYESSVESLALPTKIASISALPETQIIRRFELNHGMSPTVGMAFLINGEPYNGDRLHTQVRLNTVEDWVISNTGVMDHPFHIHGNAFQVISRNGIPESLIAWRDTVLVGRGETVRLRIPFRDFAGQTVYHCHILDHEDLGMMGNLMINA